MTQKDTPVEKNVREKQREDVCLKMWGRRAKETFSPFCTQDLTVFPNSVSLLFIGVVTLGLSLLSVVTYFGKFYIFELKNYKEFLWHFNRFLKLRIIPVPFPKLRMSLMSMSFGFRKTSAFFQNPAPKLFCCLLLLLTFTLFSHIFSLLPILSLTEWLFCL